MRGLCRGLLNLPGFGFEDIYAGCGSYRNSFENPYHAYQLSHQAREFFSRQATHNRRWITQPHNRDVFRKSDSEHEKKSVRDRLVMSYAPLCTTPFSKEASTTKHTFGERRATSRCHACARQGSYHLLRRLDMLEDVLT